MRGFPSGVAKTGKMVPAEGNSVVVGARRHGAVSRNYAALISGFLLAACTAAVAAYVAWGPWSKSLLIGDASGFQIAYFAGVVGLLSFTVFVLTVSSQRWWLVVAIPAGLAATALLVLAILALPLAQTKVTPILVDGCPSGYIALEELNGAGVVGVRDGVHVVTIQPFRADDFGTPFSHGTYSALLQGDRIEVAYEGGAGFSLPAVASLPCR
jgi:hypothetical protein